MKVNYHTHNYRCNHADGNVEEYVVEAIKEGYLEVGISDHLSHPGKDIDTYHRMDYKEIGAYFKEIEEVKEKYGELIMIKKGLECEYFEDFDWLYKELKEVHNIEYMILGVHFFPYNGEWLYVGGVDMDEKVLESYIDYVVKSMENGEYLYIAHPDIFGMSYRNWDKYSEKAARRILETAEKLQLPLEININGMRKSKIKYNKGIRYQYPHKDFWELSKEYNVKTIVGVDAHSPKELGDLQMGIDFANNLEINILLDSMF